MDEPGLEYPDDDLDDMLDDELEIMRELEAERDKENSPHKMSKKTLDFASPGNTRLRPIDGNVGIGNSNKRPRSDDVDDGIELFNTLEEEEEMIRQSEKSPSNKRFKKTTSPSAHQIGEDVAASQVRIRIPRVGERKVYKRIPEEDFQAVTGLDGSLMYLKMCKKSAVDEVGVCKAGAGDKRPVGLCGVPFHELREVAEMEMVKLKSAAETRGREEADSGVESGEEGETELWVEKFRPRGYTQLLSDDGTNRILLSWLKLWDKVVFNKDKKPKVKPSEDEEPKWGGPNLPEVIEEYDSLGRPQQRVALLHGPPGLGKTTLAHIIARHAGYNVVEMNASDDTSIDAFKKKLENSTQMRSVIAQDQRPNCLIIDEIDGAGAPAVNHLVSVLSGNKTEKKSKKGGTGNILRPIICICNDLYTPALRPLRQLSLTVPFPPTRSSRLAGRLQTVCGREKLKTDLTALLALCQKTDNDIRSCLSTLQFFRKSKGVLRAADVARASVGTKDSHRSLYSVWQDIFSIPRPGKTGHSGAGDEEEEVANSTAARYKNMLSTVYSCGEYDRLLAGVFDLYLEVKFKDSGMANVVHGLEWFSHFDVLHKQMLHTQNYILMGHLPFPLVVAHLLFASSVKHFFKFPSQQSDNNTRLAKNQNILESVVAEMAPAARTFANSSVLVRDVLPLLLSVVQPSLRPVNTQLYSAREKAELASLVDVHIMYNLTYTQERTPETGQYEYRMDPDIENVVCYPDIKRPVRLSYATKQLISHEIHVEKMKRADRGSPENAVDLEHVEKAAAAPTPTAAKSTTSHLQKLRAKHVDDSKKVATDFFGRVVKVDPNKPAATVTNDIIKSDIWFKFKEGYSNAVRRTVKIKDLI